LQDRRPAQHATAQIPNAQVADEAFDARQTFNEAADDGARVSHRLRPGQPIRRPGHFPLADPASCSRRSPAKYTKLPKRDVARFSDARRLVRSGAFRPHAVVPAQPDLRLCVSDQLRRPQPARRRHQRERWRERRRHFSEVARSHALLVARKPSDDRERRIGTAEHAREQRDTQRRRLPPQLRRRDRLAAFFPGQLSNDGFRRSRGRPRAFGVGRAGSVERREVEVQALRDSVPGQYHVRPAHGLPLRVQPLSVQRVRRDLSRQTRLHVSLHHRQAPVI